MTDKRVKLGRYKTIEERNFELYHAHFSACQTPKEIAREFQLSKSYVYLLLEHLNLDQEKGHGQINVKCMKCRRI